MSKETKVVSIHPYFRVHPGKLPAVKPILRAFIAKTQQEKKNLYYDFTINGDVVFCREAYESAEGLLEHLANVKAELDEMFKVVDLARLEIHGPAGELEKLKEPFAAMKPEWFTYECGAGR